MFQPIFGACFSPYSGRVSAHFRGVLQPKCRGVLQPSVLIGVVLNVFCFASIMHQSIGRQWLFDVPSCIESSTLVSPCLLLLQKGCHMRLPMCIFRVQVRGCLRGWC